MLAEYGGDGAGRGEGAGEYDEIDRARLLLAYTRRQKFNARLIAGQLAEAMGGGGASTGSATGASTGSATGASTGSAIGGYRQVDPATLFAMMGIRAD